MAQHLPDDVWSDLAETWLDQGALQNLSLTSRRMQQLVVPVLFRHLEFDIFHAELESLMARLIRNNLRAQFLYNSPDLLRHTRSFTFWENAHVEDSIAEYLALHEDSDSFSWRCDAENFLTFLHGTIYRLIFRMPGLRELHISNTVMTPLSYAAISSRRLLTSLSLQPRHLPNITHISPALPHTYRLRDFAYFNTWTGNDRTTDPCLADILDHSILDLEKLTISLILLPLVVSGVPSDHTLSLRSLSVRFLADPESSESLAVAAFFHVLRACPQLQHLSIQGDFPNIEPTHCISPPSLPNLSTFSGTCRLLPILSGRKSLAKIDIHDNIYIKEQLLTQIILSPPPHLRELSMAFVIFSQTPRELLSFLRSLSVFRNLERLCIVYENNMPWKHHVSAQDSHGAIKHLLDRLACLRFLDIRCWSDHVEGYDIGCPISKQDDPTDRGHPSLEGVYVDFICGMWSWDPRSGWERSDWALP